MRNAADALLSSRSSCRDDALDQNAIDDDWTSAMVSIVRTTRPDSERAVSVRWDEFDVVVTMQPLVDNGPGFEFPEPVVDYKSSTNPRLEQTGALLCRALRHRWGARCVRASALNDFPLHTGHNLVNVYFTCEKVDHEEYRFRAIDAWRAMSPRPRPQMVTEHSRLDKFHLSGWASQRRVVQTKRLRYHHRRRRRPRNN